ncbi:MAG: hypothetical protein LH615_03120 [Ferruginibacter sp.]|nr:hypothetical protein [Ferruginibacter sp.]
MEWTLYITYGITPFELKAKLVYESNQIMRIEVEGKTSTLLLENNYPLMRSSNSKKAIQWKLRKGILKNGDAKDARLLTNIIQQLERNLKQDYPKLF